MNQYVKKSRIVNKRIIVNYDLLNNNETILKK